MKLCSEHKTQVGLGGSGYSVVSVQILTLNVRRTGLKLMDHVSVDGVKGGPCNLLDI